MWEEIDRKRIARAKREREHLQSLYRDRHFYLKV
jgi:hypothetical protein